MNSQKNRLVKKSKSKKLKSGWTIKTVPDLPALLSIDFGTYMDGFHAGIQAAASYIEAFDKYVNHEWRLSDCLKSKFNQLKKSKVRKNKRTHVIVGIWNKPQK